MSGGNGKDAGRMRGGTEALHVQHRGPSDSSDGCNRQAADRGLLAGVAAGDEEVFRVRFYICVARGGGVEEEIVE